MSVASLYQGSVTEVIHGVVITDPFRWLEDRNSPATVTWIRDQQLLHNAYFTDICSVDVLRSRAAAYLDVDAIDQPVKLKVHMFFRLRQKHHEQGSLFVRTLASASDHVLVDPSLIGPYASVGINHVAPDGSLVAYELRHGGSDSREIHFVDVATKMTLPDFLPRGYPRGLVFSLDKDGVFYSHDAVNAAEEHRIQFHRFGSFSKDAVLLQKARTPRSRLVLLSDGLLLGAIYIRDQGPDLLTDFYIADFTSNPTWTEVFVDKPNAIAPFLHHGRLFALTDEKAPNKSLIEFAKDGSQVRVLVPESDSPVKEIAWDESFIYVRYLINRKASVRRWTLDGNELAPIVLPAVATIRFLPRLTFNPETLFYTYESFTEPLSVHELPSLTSYPDGHPGHQQVSHNNYLIEEVSYRSKDGTFIPMSLVRMRKLLSPRPTAVLLTSYGGFGVSMTPKFSALVTIMLELGVVFALPHIRGGSEFGRSWHEAAMGRNRQRAIDDFISAAEWLSVSSVTSGCRLGIFGGSNSGLLVAAAATQRPDLFHAVVCIAPLLDMVRYQSFDRARKFEPEYGTVDDEADFLALYRYSPYHHLADDVDYPAMLFVTGDQDERCSPAHARKMVARLQSRSCQTSPILIDHSEVRGHSPVLPLSFRIEALSRRIAFLCSELRIPIPGVPL